jgi:SAM-dependent methyltransferase
VDLGCGSGVTTRAFVDAGHDVLGVDASAAMLELARRAAPAATFIKASALEVPLPDRCAAVVAVGEVLNYTVSSAGAGGAGVRPTASASTGRATWPLACVLPGYGPGSGVGMRASASPPATSS